ncbi:hypothetical protein [Pseudomonas putida]|uniref:hypothetical protein n=1 Tax=Pseudomonas putida TaxID=303 RepID=UPI00125D9A29|nr:hypothetical protein [Pseudomonas putida]
MSSQKSIQNPRNQKPVFYDCYSTVMKAVDKQYDVRGYLLAELVVLCLKNRAKVPLARRAYYERCVQKEALTYLEHFTSQLLFGPNGRFSPHEYCYSHH